MNLLFDIGATHMRLAVAEGDAVNGIQHLDTPQDPEEAIALLASETKALGGTAAYGGIPAIVADGAVVSATNLSAWNGFPFAERLSDALALPVFVRNDAELAGLGEAVYGAGKGAERVAYIGVGTGVGTSFIASGSIVPGSSDEGRARIIKLGDGSSLEERIGGRALASQYGIPPEQLPGSVWSELAAYLAEGVRTAVALWSPQVVVLGGSLVDDLDGFRVTEVARLAEFEPILPAKQKDASGLYGALAWSHII